MNSSEIPPSIQTTTHTPIAPSPIPEPSPNPSIEIADDSGNVRAVPDSNSISTNPTKTSSIVNNPVIKNPSRTSFTSVLPTSSFPVSRNKKLQHKFLGLEWKFLEDTEYGDTLTLDHQAIDLNKSMFTSGKNPQNRSPCTSPRSPRIYFDKSATVLSTSTPRKPNGLVPEEPDTAEDLLNTVALQILDDEYETILAKEKMGILDTKSKKGGLIKQILGVFQDASDDRFARRLSLHDEEKRKEIEEADFGGEDVGGSDDENKGEIDLRNPATLYLKRSDTPERIKAEVDLNRRESLEKRVERTKSEAERLGSAIHFFDPEFNKEVLKEEEKLSTSEKGGHGEGENGTDPAAKPTRNTIIDAEKVITLKVELPIHVDRPPSPIVFARSLQPIKIAEDVPVLLLATEARQRAAMANPPTASLPEYAKAAVEEIWEGDGESDPSSSDESYDNVPAYRMTRPSRLSKPRGPAPTHRGRKLTSPRRSQARKLQARKSKIKGRKRGESSVSEGIFDAPSNGQGGSDLTKRAIDAIEQLKKTKVSNQKKNVNSTSPLSPTEKVRYGAWYIKPEKWTVGIYNVLNEMAAKQQGSWGVEMASIKAKADNLQREIPKLFIGKAFTKDLVGKGYRLPHFLSRVVLEDDVNLEWLKSLAGGKGGDSSRGKKEFDQNGRMIRRTRHTRGGTFLSPQGNGSSALQAPEMQQASPRTRERRTMTLLRKNV